MARDYAKKTAKKTAPKPRKKQRRGKNKSAPGWMWLTAGLTVGLLIAGLYFLSNHGATTATQLAKAKTTKKVAQPKPKKPQQPEFDFYTMLPQTQAPVINAGKGQAPAQENSDNYVLQVASVKQYTDADRLKAELTLLGFNVFIQKYQAGKVAWNRVNVGPFASAQQAKLDQKRLRKNNINSILLNVK